MNQDIDDRIERVARAICEAEMMNPDDILGGWVHWTDAARAAIRAMPATAVSCKADSPVVTIQRALLDDEHFGTGAEDQDDLEYCALKSAEMIAEALGIGDLTSANTASPQQSPATHTHSE